MVGMSDVLWDKRLPKGKRACWLTLAVFHARIGISYFDQVNVRESMKHFWLGFFIFLSTIVFVYRAEIKRTIISSQQSHSKEQQLRAPEVLVETRLDRKLTIKNLLLCRQKGRLFLRGKFVLGNIHSNDIKNGTMVDIAAKTGRTLELFQKVLEEGFQRYFVRLNMRNKKGFIIGNTDLYFNSDILPLVKKDNQCIFFEINCSKLSNLDLEDVATLTAVLDLI